MDRLTGSSAGVGTGGVSRFYPDSGIGEYGRERISPGIALTGSGGIGDFQRRSSNHFGYFPDSLTSSSSRFSTHGQHHHLNHQQQQQSQLQEDQGHLILPSDNSIGLTPSSRVGQRRHGSTIAVDFYGSVPGSSTSAAVSPGLQRGAVIGRALQDAVIAAGEGVFDGDTSPSIPGTGLAGTTTTAATALFGYDSHQPSVRYFQRHSPMSGFRDILIFYI